MSNQTARETAEKKMAELLAKRAADLDVIAEKTEEANVMLAAAQGRLKDATTIMDMAAYDQAKVDTRKARNAIEMYDRRLQQIHKQELISEADSDAIIDQLLQYEDELAAEFKAAIVEPLRKLQELHRAYTAEIRATEDTLTAWQNNIHANRRSFGGSLYRDPVTGKMTNRNQTPLPVHRIAFRGCDAALSVEGFLNGPGRELLAQ